MAKAKRDTAEILRQLDVKELSGKLASARKDLFDMKLKRSEQKDPFKIRWARRNIARILTIIKEKESGTVEKSK